MKKLSLLISIPLFFSSVFADEKRDLNGNMTLKYKKLPPAVESAKDIFSQGIFYGRIRLNTFFWDWKNEYDGKTKDNYAVGFGGSLIFKSAEYKGLSFTSGLYTSQNPIHMDAENVGYIKAGKDTLARSDGRNGDFGITTLAENYIQYRNGKNTIRIGRQLFESVITKSNDTKMIPNTFDGVTLVSKAINKTKISLAYFWAQKLRDHVRSHDVITFKDSEGDKWLNNDDSAIHKGLSYDNFVKHGEDTDHNLYIASLTDTHIRNLKLSFTYDTVPDVVSHATVEAHYTISAGGWKITPGIRYLTQIDEGGGEIGGASLSGKLAGWKPGDDKRGYDEPDTLDSSLFAARVVAKKGNLKLLYGYSAIEDKADIVAPWRGFPTGGYTRAMGQYNWNANTVTHMVQSVYNFKQYKFKISARYAIMDFDEDKKDVSADRNILHIDLFKKFDACPDLETKFRFATVDSDEKNGKDYSYNEYRLEFNYLF